MKETKSLKRKNGKKAAAIAVLVVAVVLMAFLCLFVGSSHMSVMISDDEMYQVCGVRKGNSFNDCGFSSCGVHLSER